jgi:hypothetical protein
MFSASDAHCQLRASCESTIPAPSHEYNTLFLMTEVFAGKTQALSPFYLPEWVQSPKVLKYPLPSPLILGMSPTCGLYYPC